MNVSIRLFAILRERAGRDTVEIDLDDGATVADALEVLSAEPGLGEVIGKLPVTMAVNRDYADSSTPLASGDELALIPPVSGGDGSIHVAICEEPLSLEGITSRVRSPRAGATVTFQGTTRDVDHLDYEAYAEMAAERIEAILREMVERHGLEAAAAEHRVGTVPLAEPSVIVAVSAAHREEAFAGAREAIDRIKAEAPIWKREAGADGEGEWVEGTAPAERASR